LFLLGIGLMVWAKKTSLVFMSTIIFFTCFILLQTSAHEIVSYLPFGFMFLSIFRIMGMTRKDAEATTYFE
jgi:hypothetical protein